MKTLAIKKYVILTEDVDRMGEILSRRLLAEAEARGMLPVGEPRVRKGRIGPETIQRELAKRQCPHPDHLPFRVSDWEVAVFLNVTDPPQIEIKEETWPESVPPSGS